MSSRVQGVVEGKCSKWYGSSGIDNPDRGEESHLSWGQRKMVLLGEIWEG